MKKEEAALPVRNTQTGCLHQVGGEILTFQNPASGGRAPIWEEEPAVRQLLQDLVGAQVAHAYLFSGGALERKKEAALSFAQALLCTALESGGPCGICPSCRAWARRAHPDFHFLEPQGNSLKIGQIRAWRPFFNYRPRLGKHQVFFLEAPELLTAPAANSLLKALEEPLPRTVFLLVTGDYRTLLPTLVSRCRLLIFRQQEEGAPGRTLQDLAEPAKAASITRLLWEGKESELLGAVRLFGPDREAGRGLLNFVLADLERIYRTQRSLICQGAGDAETGLGLLECLAILERGLSLLEANVQVSLLLALTLRKAQKRLQELSLDLEH